MTMAWTTSQTALVLTVLATALCGPATAQTGCGATLISLVPCVSYITGSSSPPSSSCCSQLATTVRSSPQCLCSVINGGVASSFGLNVNRTLALQLPGACNVKTPPASQCDAANGPAASAISPVAGGPEADISPSASTGPLGGGSKTAPSSSSDGPRVALNFFIFFAFCSSILIRF